MGVSSASGETQERVRRILQGLEGVAQIKDDIVVHGAWEEHDNRLREVFKKKHNLTLNPNKCKLGRTRVRIQRR